MLPSVVSPRLTRAALAGAAALALIAASAAPVQAFGRNERNFLQGMAAAAIIGTIYNDMRSHARPAPRQYYAPAPVYSPPPVYVRPPVYAPAPVYTPPAYVPPVQYRPAPPVYQPSLYSTPLAAAFNSYRYSDRVRIQQRLASQGYYRSNVDGAFGPGTYTAIAAWAQDNGQGRALGTSAGAYGLLDSLVY